jgi:hypothetical protein
MRTSVGLLGGKKELDTGLPSDTPPLELAIPRTISGSSRSAISHRIQLRQAIEEDEQQHVTASAQASSSYRLRLGRCAYESCQQKQHAVLRVS